MHEHAALTALAIALNITMLTPAVLANAWGAVGPRLMVLEGFYVIAPNSAGAALRIWQR
jgi:hypothetical protein